MGLLISERTYTVISRTYTQSVSVTPIGKNYILYQVISDHIVQYPNIFLITSPDL